jgi:hypothetical protein
MGMLTETSARYDIPTYKQGKFIIAKEFEGVSKERCAEPRLADCFSSGDADALRDSTGSRNWRRSWVGIS